MSRCARPEARSTLRSLSAIGHEQPTSPITPALMPVGSLTRLGVAATNSHRCVGAPTVTSPTISSTISSSDRLSMSSGCVCET